MTELIINTCEFTYNSGSVYDVILNRLDLRHDNNGKSYLYDPEEFRKALPLFKETPLVFAGVHPQNIGKLSMDDALKEVNGRLIGTPQDVLVNDAGTLFRGKVKITDPEVNELIKNGKALLSTAFSATPDADGVLKNIVPNHILVYPASTGILPGDHAALFLNQKTEKTDLMAIEEFIKNVESTLAELKRELAKEKIQNQAEKTYAEINAELSMRL